MSIFDKKPPLGGLALFHALSKAPTSNQPKYTLADLARGGLLDPTPRRPQRTLAALLASSQSPLGLAEVFGPRPDSDEFIQAAWDKAPHVAGFDPAYIRKDRFGAFIARSDYGKESTFGWHIDHVVPKSKGGSDELYNREPLYWRNNLAKSDHSI